MTKMNVVQRIPTHDCGTDFLRKPVRIQKDGREYDWVTNYCARCETYVYNPPGEERFETDSPKKMGEYITNQIKLGKALW